MNVAAGSVPAREKGSMTNQEPWLKGAEPEVWSEWDAWIAAHDRVVAAQAWDEGKDAGAIWGLNPWNATPPNPYRTEEEKP